MNITVVAGVTHDSMMGKKSKEINHNTDLITLTWSEENSQFQEDESMSDGNSPKKLKLKPSAESTHPYCERDVDPNVYNDPYRAFIKAKSTTIGMIKVKDPINLIEPKYLCNGRIKDGESIKPIIPDGFGSSFIKAKDSGTGINNKDFNDEPIIICDFGPKQHRQPVLESSNHQSFHCPEVTPTKVTNYNKKRSTKNELQSSCEPDFHYSSNKYSGTGIMSIVAQKDPVLFRYSNDTPVTALTRANDVYNINLIWRVFECDGAWLCQIFYGDYLVALSRRYSMETAAEAAAATVLKQLQKYCYTVEVSENLFQIPVFRADLEHLLPERPHFWSGYKNIDSQSNSLPYRNEMMDQSHNLLQNLHTHAFARECRKILHCHFMNTVRDLVFHSFRDDEISLIASIASDLGLKHSIYCLNENVIAVSHNYSTEGLIDFLIRKSGVSGRYKLIRPLISSRW